MCKLNGVNRHYSAMTKIALPLLVSILVIDAVLDVIREQIFQFNRCAKFQAQLGVFSSGHCSVMAV